MENFYFGLDTATAADRLGFDREMEASELLTPYESDSPEEDARGNWLPCEKGRST